MSAQKGCYHVPQYIPSPLMCSEKGKPLGGSWGGGWGAQPKLLSVALSESVAMSVPLLLHGVSTQARILSPAFHMISLGHLLQDTFLQTTP